jgi:hypothetical protein
MGHTGEAKWCPKASSRGDAKQPRRCQAAEETRGPQSGRAQEGRRALDEVSGSRPRECRAFAFAFRGVEVLLQPKV